MRLFRRRTREFVPLVEPSPRLPLLGFLRARIKELEDVDPDGAERCRRVLDDCSEVRNLSVFADDPPYYVRGAVKDWGPLLKLARNWAAHPDFRPEWETP